MTATGVPRINTSVVYRIRRDAVKCTLPGNKSLPAKRYMALCGWSVGVLEPHTTGFCHLTEQPTPGVESAFRRTLFLWKRSK
jgi:hypothetical protein